MVDPTAPPPPAATRTVLDLLADRIAVTPQATAVERGPTRWSYAELGSRVDAYAGGLLARGVQPGDVVGIDGRRDPETVVTILAVLAAGAVALPLDPGQSALRRQSLLDEAGAKTLVTPPPPPAAGGAPLAPGADDPAYVFFTSGTTGRPKGILGRHGSLAHFVSWEQRTLDFGPQDRVAQVAALCFDAVLKDVLPVLLGGGTLCLPPVDTPFAHPDVVVNWLADERITVAQTVPSVLGAWLDAVAAGDSVPDLSALRLVCLAGEPLQAALVRRFRTVFPTFTGRIVNLYGVTEATVLQSWYEVPADPGDGIQPVGHAIDDVQLLVVGPDGRQCGSGETGEVVIRSPHLTAGYLHGEPTFMPNPFRDDPGDLVYRTGDLGRLAPDGTLSIVGRLDDQVKINGVRVQPAEVAAALSAHPDVAAAVVVARDGALVGYVVPAPGVTPAHADLRGHLAERLSSAAVPARFVELDGFPLGENGKVDRAALPEPPDVTAGDDGPLSGTEQRVATIWTEVLGVPVAGRDQDFFDLGGQSLTMFQVIARLSAEFDAEVSMRQFFEHSTLVELSTLVDREAGRG
ncbi:non-ribosomal peptide synthetase [Micromonospora sp. WMMD1120]|uniref:non-ribosomal peptide synthetase n=1 Tax=Micromonospora sp. WMMD1120 TaxID=3016106 RepID=UPI0024163E2C|nr:non-ribosomal peptide synthetase [Micromonospora sp. WMMD1120]MDG4807542.1 non-ribosomal peptide synthetase [Micromonospora sp. WMMD1120]